MSDSQRVVVVTAGFKSAPLDELRHDFPDLRFEECGASEVPPELWRSAEIAYAMSRLPGPGEAPRLRWVQLHSAGVENVVRQPLFQSDVSFTTSSGVHAIPISEYVLATTLALFRRVPRMVEMKPQGHWPPDGQRWSLFVPEETWGKTMAILGYGSIGRQVARLAKGVGMRVLAMQRGTDRRDRGFVEPGIGDPEGTLPDKYFSPDQLPDLLEQADAVVVCLPLTPRTRGLLNEAAFRAMRPSAILVNIARGGICDEPALVRALSEGWVGGAALDVFQEEPLPPESPLWKLPNVILSPHVSGFSPEYDRRAARIFATNLRRYLAGQPLLNLVDKEQGY